MSQQTAELVSVTLLSIGYGPSIVISCLAKHAFIHSVACINLVSVLGLLFCGLLDLWPGFVTMAVLKVGDSTVVS